MAGSKKGAAFVEAALVFPLIVLIIALLISYSSRNFLHVQKQIENHAAAREKSMDVDIIDKDECEFVRMIDLLLEEE
ncbi:hypothetical protein MASR2M70_02700 [Bacillota bacterium]